MLPTGHSSKTPALKTLDALPTEIPTSTPGTIPETPLPLRETTEPDPQITQEQPQYLLTTEELPGWQYTRSMDFLAEPTFEATDCDLMNQAWGAHAQPGSRIRAGSDEVNLRQTVVEMPDAASATAVLDAADRVWLECTALDVAGDTWWIEPVEIPRSRRVAHERHRHRAKRLDVDHRLLATR